MRSQYSMHNRMLVEVFCYAAQGDDGSEPRATIKAGCVSLFAARINSAAVWCCGLARCHARNTCALARRRVGETTWRHPHAAPRNNRSQTQNLKPETANCKSYTLNLHARSSPDALEPHPATLRTPKPQPENTAMRCRCDKFVEMVGWSHQQMADQIRDDNINVLIDTTGYTMNMQTEVFAIGPSPVQVCECGCGCGCGCGWV